MPLILSLPHLSRKKQQQQQPQRRPTISHPFPSTASPHPLPSPHPSTPWLGAASTPSTLNHSLLADTSSPTPRLRPSSPLALPARTHASDKQRRSKGVRYQDWLILPGRNAAPPDGRDKCLPELPGRADAGAATLVVAADSDAVVEFETAMVFTALAREDPRVCARWARMAECEGKGFAVDAGVVARVEGKVDLEVVDAFLDVALEGGNGRVLRARLARRRGGLKPGQPNMVGYDEEDCFGGESEAG